MSAEKGLAALTAVLETLYGMRGAAIIDEVEAAFHKWRGDVELDRKARAAGYVKPGDGCVIMGVDLAHPQSAHGFYEVRGRSPADITSIPDDLITGDLRQTLHGTGFLDSGPRKRALENALRDAYRRGWNNRGTWMAGPPKRE